MSVGIGIHKVRGTIVRGIASMPPHWSAGQAKDLDEFIDLAEHALRDYQKRLGISSGEQLVLREEYPKDPVEAPDVGLNLAVISVVSRKLTNTTNDGERRPWRPREVETVEHPEDSSLFLTTLVLEMDNVVEIRIMSPHAKRANEWALFFERFVLAYSWYFKEMGIAQIQFDERREDTIEKIGGEELHVRPLRFFVRTQIVTQKVARKIDEILVHYDVGPLLRHEVTDEQYGVSEFSVARPGSTS